MYLALPKQCWSAQVMLTSMQLWSIVLLHGGRIKQDLWVRAGCMGIPRGPRAAMVPGGSLSFRLGSAASRAVSFADASPGEAPVHMQLQPSLHTI